MLAQISILLLFYRIFGHFKKFRVALGSAGFIIFSFWLSSTVCLFLGCEPFRSLPGKCINMIEYLRINAVFNFIINISIFLLPIPMIWSLDITVRQKLEVISVTSVGLLYVSYLCHEKVLNS